MDKQVSKNFKRSEFACKCGCGFCAVDVELVEIAELARKLIGPFTPNSVCRCVKHNRDIGGEPGSKHVFAMAMDIPTNEPRMLYEFFDNEFPDSHGLGIYDWGVHIDAREPKSRWDRRTTSRK